MKCELCSEDRKKAETYYYLPDGRMVHLSCLVEGIKVITEYIKQNKNAKEGQG